MDELASYRHVGIGNIVCCQRSSANLPSLCKSPTLSLGGFLQYAGLFTLEETLTPKSTLTETAIEENTNTRGKMMSHSIVQIILRHGAP